MTASEKASLEVDDVTHHFTGVTALDGVSLAVQPEELTAIIGPNGSGKTTLLRIIAGVLHPDDGEVRSHDMPATRDIGYLPQDPRFRPGFTCTETLAFYADLAGVDREEIPMLLERVGLAEASDTRVEDLSGGMTGLLGIAQAMIGDPAIAVMDEPTTGLDPGIRHHIFEVIDDLGSVGCGIIIASHDLELVQAHADRIAILDNGELVAMGSISTLRERFGEATLSAIYDVAIESEPTAITVRRDQR